MARKQKDIIINKLEATPDAKEKFILLKKENQNTRLAEFVTNSNDLRNIIEYNGELFQKSDPIYQEPDTRFIKSHFYSPYKMLLGAQIDTFWMNILVIWFSIVTLYIALYYRWFRKILNYGELFSIYIKEKFNLQTD